MVMYSRTFVLIYLLILIAMGNAACNATSKDSSTELAETVERKKQLTIDPFETLILSLQNMSLSLNSPEYSPEILITLTVGFAAFHGSQFVSVRLFKNTKLGMFFLVLEILMLLLMFFEGLVFPGILTSMYINLTSKSDDRSVQRTPMHEVLRIFLSFYILQAIFELVKKLVIMGIQEAIEWLLVILQVREINPSPFAGLIDHLQ